MTDGSIRFAMLISGSGTTAEAVLKAWRNGEIDSMLPVAVIASRSDALGIEKARALGVPTFVADNSILLPLLRQLRVDVGFQNGWLPLTPALMVRAYKGRIINQHPGPLDPAGPVDFGGHGMYGARVTAA